MPIEMPPIFSYAFRFLSTFSAAYFSLGDFCLAERLISVVILHAFCALIVAATLHEVCPCCQRRQAPRAAR